MTSLEAAQGVPHCVRGDDALKIQQRAGHTSLTRTAEAVGEVIGAVFPALPASLQTTTNGVANRLKDPQAIDFVVEVPGIEADQRQTVGTIQQ